MATPRSEVVQEGVEGLYHCFTRCVRRAFLCGYDHYSGRSYEHRREWIYSKLKALAASYAVEVLAYTVMSNHLHIILRTRPDWVDEWSDEGYSDTQLLSPVTKPAKTTGLKFCHPGLQA